MIDGLHVAPSGVKRGHEDEEADGDEKEARSDQTPLGPSRINRQFHLFAKMRHVVFYGCNSLMFRSMGGNWPRRMSLNVAKNRK
jgi:hypothetical protein